MVSIEGVQFQYGDGTPMHFPDFSCNQGERLLLLGDSGTGKTTLLHLLCGLLRADAGTIKSPGARWVKPRIESWTCGEVQNWASCSSGPTSSKV